MEKRGAGSNYGEGLAILSQSRIKTTLVRGLFTVDITLPPSLLLQTTACILSASHLELLLCFFSPSLRSSLASFTVYGTSFLPLSLAVHN